MKPQSPTEYLKNKQMRENIHFTHNGTDGYYTLKGTQIPEKEFNRLFPLSDTVRIPNRRWKGENIDGRTIK